MKRLFTASMLALLLGSCGDDAGVTPDDGSLAAYFEQNPSLTRVNALIACASGGQEDFLESETYPVLIYFLPEEGSTDFRYFETDSIELDNSDMSLYHEVTLNDQPIFGGFLRYFEREATERETWSIVTFVKGDSLHYSNPIRLKFPRLRSEFNPSLLTLSQEEPLSPRFEWEDGRIEENEIYFHAITGPDGNLLSGTYTFDRHWQFYDLSNVVLNIREVTPPPELVPNENYTYTMLGVSIDNWVNLIITLEFDTF